MVKEASLMNHLHSILFCHWISGAKNTKWQNLAGKHWKEAFLLGFLNLFITIILKLKKTNPNEIIENEVNKLINKNIQTFVVSVTSSDKLAHSATISWVSFFLHWSPLDSESLDEVTSPGLSFTVESIG